MTKPILSAQNLTKQYVIQNADKARYDLLTDKINPRNWIKSAADKPSKKIFSALEDVSFSVKPGERIGVIGRNGAGKSTLLKLVSRITEATSGKIGLNGRVASLLEVGTGFHPELTGRENIYLNGTILGMSQKEIRSKYDEIVSFAGIEEFIETPVKRYSSGMYVRLAFSVAAHLESEILIVDEVLAVGDAAFQKKCLSKMDDISRTGRTFLFVSHNLSTIQQLCDRVLYLKDGNLEFDGAVAEGIKTYLDDTQSEFYGLGQFELNDIKRYGNGDILFDQVTLDAVNHTPDDIKALRTGDDGIIDVTLTAKNEVKDANIAIIIYDLMGTRIIDANLAIQGKAASFAAGETQSFRFVLEDLLLKPGEYMLGLWCGVPNTDIDGIGEALRFRVDEPLSQTKYAATFPGLYQCKFSVEPLTNFTKKSASL